MNAQNQSCTNSSGADPVPLYCLRAGQGGCVCGVVGTCDVVHRLREMGLYDGAQVQMLRPGSPCIIRLHGQRLGFRMDDCACVMVRMTALAS
ncbi:MAG: FeoA family protein [Isosphaeraceae bacterium]